MPVKKQRVKTYPSWENTVRVTVRLKKSTVRHLQVLEPGLKMSTLLRELAEELADKQD